MNNSLDFCSITIDASHLLGDPSRTASDKINVAYIGPGTQELCELPALLNIPDVQVTAICDPQRKAISELKF